MLHYQAEYEKKLVTSEKAAAMVPDDATLIHGVTIAEPPALLAAIAQRAREGGFQKISIYSFNPQRHAAATYLAPDLCNCIYAYTWFLSPASRHLATTGLVQFIPCYLHQVPKFIQEYMEVDVAVTTVSPMDKAGFFSFGTANEITSTAARKAKLLILEVNRHMPRVFGDSLVHISEVDMVVENHVPLMQLPAPAPKPEDAAVGRFIAEIIPDGAVLQLGLGTLPNAICPQLHNHKDLGIHSELIGPGLVDLIKRGVITGRKKTLLPRKHVFSVAYGTDETFEFMNDNPSMESYPSSYVMNPCVIAQNDNMIAVNSIIEVDLTGQCNAESLSGFQFSGTGGQLDFVRGAFAAKGGKSVMTFYSTAKNETVSRVVDQLPKGSAVTTPRMDVHYLATEQGIVDLKQKSVGERALAIISIAHPKFRDELMRKAEQMRMI